MRSFRAFMMAALLSLTLAPVVEARPVARPVGDPLQPLWDVLARLWAPTAPASKAGCSLDPLGGCNTTTAPTDAGCTIDPLGCSGAAAPTDEGCGIDPLGCSGR